MATNERDSADASNRSTSWLTTSEADKSKAAKWFLRARELGDKRQFDYAIEYYVNGLEFWPDAVEEGCKPLHGCAVARRQTGGKKPGFKDTMKRSMSDKDPKRALGNAFWLFGHDPDNISYLEGIVKSGVRLGAAEAAKWSAGVLVRALEATSKSTPKQCQSVAGLLEQLGDAAVEHDQAAFAVGVFEMGVTALNLWHKRNPKDRNAENSVRNLSTKLTILKGKYSAGDSFRGSMADGERQSELHDKDRAVQSEDRLAALVAKAEERFKSNPDDERNLRELVDLLCRHEAEKDETRAITLLTEEFERTGDYRHKRMADDISIKQLSRRARQAAKSGNENALKEALVVALKFELSSYKERVERYPTDNRYKFEYGVRLFRAGRFDDAIPLFQAARSDPRSRTECALYLGRCFYRKSYFSQAITTLQDEIAHYEFSDDELAKGLLYWLARAHEGTGDVAAARDSYGKILQVDYNFKDVRAKLDALPQAR